MRYYDIRITNPSTGQLVKPLYFANLPGFDSSYTSFVNGQTLGGALNIELDIPISTYAVPQQGGWLSIYGVSIQEIQQSQNLVGCNVQLFAGMKKGLPLAKPAQSVDPIMEGQIFQCFGNWVGTNMMLQMVFQPGTGRIDAPINLVLDWKANTPLRQAILAAFLPFVQNGYTVTIGISDDLKQASDQVGPYPTLATFASEILNLSRQQQFLGIKPLGGGVYGGVKITIRGKTIFVYDGTANVGLATYDNPIDIAFEDLMGQPTWVQPNVINFKTVMRSDLAVGSYVKLPSQLSVLGITLPPAAFPGAAARNQSTFKGKFEIVSLHHMGNFRQADGAAWVSIFNAVFVPEPTVINTLPVNGPSVARV